MSGAIKTYLWSRGINSRPGESSITKQMNKSLISILIVALALSTAAACGGYPSQGGCGGYPSCYRPTYRGCGGMGGYGGYGGGMGGLGGGCGGGMGGLGGGWGGGWNRPYSR